MSNIRSKVPFTYKNKEDFSKKLSLWIGQIFYDVLPEEGFEIREEQVYTAFQIAEAVGKRGIHLAEAGLGTGKTFAYLLPALAYARFTGKPALIACASTALQEQLTGPKGDIAKLSKLLDLNIDAQMAKDPSQYICDVKVNLLSTSNFEQKETDLNNVLTWAEETKLGERSEIPEVSDLVWKQVAWDETLPCEGCRWRGFCKQVKAREKYRSVQDLIICDHSIFFNDLWTRDEKIDDGYLSLLPKYSMVIFDEGHKVLLPAALRAGGQVVKEELDNMVASFEKIQDARTSLLSVSLATEEATFVFFKTLYQSTVENERTNRLTVQISAELLKAAEILRNSLDILHFELENEQGLHTEALSSSQIDVYQNRIERAAVALKRFFQNRGKDVIVWAETNDEIFQVVPRDLSGMLNKKLFSKDLPVVFSSATLGTGGDFSYLARTLGLEKYTSSVVSSPFDYEKQAITYLAPTPEKQEKAKAFRHSIEQLVYLLKTNKGKALVLTNAPSDVKKIRKALQNRQLPYEFLWEDSGERGYLVQKFREDISSVLVGSGFWEGIDVPGEALTQLVIWDLPFPPQDPLIEARRREAMEDGLDPVTTVDYPEMGLKLKQGCGRLIRTHSDHGVIAILAPVLDTPWEHLVMEALPTGTKITHNLEDITPLILKIK